MTPPHSSVAVRASLAILVAAAMSSGCAIKMVKVERDMGVVDDDFETLDRDVGPAIKEIIVQDTTVTLTA